MVYFDSRRVILTGVSRYLHQRVVEGQRLWKETKRTSIDYSVCEVLLGIFLLAMSLTWSRVVGFGELLLTLLLK